MYTLMFDGSTLGTLYSKTNPDYSPNAGDFVFFDWENRSSIWTENTSALDHVGAVFYADSTYVYTIEGNNSDRVELNRYSLSDPRIVAYGVLNWKTNDELNS